MPLSAFSQYCESIVDTSTLSRLTVLAAGAGRGGGIARARLVSATRCGGHDHSAGQVRICRDKMSESTNLSLVVELSTEVKIKLQICCRVFETVF